ANELVARMPDAVIHAGADGMILYWNDGATRIFGFTAAEAIGQSLDIIIPESLRARHWDGFDHTMKTGETRYGAGDVLAVPAIRKDGQRVSVEFTVTPFRGPDGKIVGIAAVLRDVSKRFAETRALRRELEALRAAQKENPAPEARG
ncbi:MAG: PAS domain-containing protein, partial [Acetobacteraceae bacterium]